VSSTAFLLSSAQAKAFRVQYLMPSLIIVFILAVALSLILFAAFVSYLMGWWGVWTGYMRAPRFYISIADVNESLVLRVYVVNEGMRLLRF